MGFISARTNCHPSHLYGISRSSHSYLGTDNIPMFRSTLLKDPHGGPAFLSSWWYSRMVPTSSHTDTSLDYRIQVQVIGIRSRAQRSASDSIYWRPFNEYTWAAEYPLSSGSASTGASDLLKVSCKSITRSPSAFGSCFGPPSRE